MDTNKAGKGFIIRNGKGEVMATLAEKISMASLVEFVEAIANHCSFFFFFGLIKLEKQESQTIQWLIGISVANLARKLTLPITSFGTKTKWQTTLN